MKKNLKYEVSYDGGNVFVSAKMEDGRSFSRICLSGEWAGIDEEKEIRRMKREIREEAKDWGYLP